MNWEPFTVCAPSERAAPMRPFATREGLGDRLRTAAFAERQAYEAFFWAAERFSDAAPEQRAVWRRLAAEEKRHYEMIVLRMRELGVAVGERTVSDRLWTALAAAKTSVEFSFLMRRSEERGRAAELSFRDKLASSDPGTSRLFAAIAEDEERHIALAQGGAQR